MPPKMKVPKKPVAEAESHVKVEQFNKDTKQKDVVMEKGTALEQKQKVNPVSSIPQGKTLVGLAKGTTLNMGNYQSARIDCWIVRVADDNEKSVMDALSDMSALIDEHIEYEVGNLDIEK